MSIKVGDRLPSVTLMHMTEKGPAPVTTDELFGKKKAVVFAVPGAFTPTCSARHLPGFVEHAGDFTKKGVDAIVCLSVNDAFVMNAWGKDQSVGDKVMMLADGNGTFSKALGLELDASKFGMGTRGQRFSFIAKDGVVTQLNIEAPGEFKVSSAEHALSQL